MSEITIKPASASDLEPIKEILRACELPTAGVDDHWKTFLVARDGERLIACGGAEAHQFAALIRSIAVLPEYRGSGIGRRLVRQLIDRLASRGLREFYLLTTNAEEYFKKRGFRPIDRDQVHPQLLESHEFRRACPDTAICMRLVMQ
jgi:amino-acid N-acetyltransferase